MRLNLVQRVATGLHLELVRRARSLMVKTQLL